MWYDFLKKEIRIRGELSGFSFYCNVCKTFSCRISCHKRMAYNAQRFLIYNWEDYTDENEDSLRREGHFKCQTFRNSYIQTKKRLLKRPD